MLKLNIDGLNLKLSLTESKAFVLNNAALLAAKLPGRDKRIAARKSRQGSYIMISGLGATDKNGNPITHYKGQPLNWLNDIAGDFTRSVKVVESRTAELVAQYGVQPNQVEIEHIKIKTASNEAERDTQTGIMPIELDKESTAGSADKFAWYNAQAKIAGTPVASGWLCWCACGRATWTLTRGAWPARSSLCMPGKRSGRAGKRNKKIPPMAGFFLMNNFRQNPKGILSFRRRPE